LKRAVQAPEGKERPEAKRTSRKEREREAEDRQGLLQGIKTGMREAREQLEEKDKKEKKAKETRRASLEEEQRDVKRTTGKVTRPFQLIQLGTDMQKEPFSTPPRSRTTPKREREGRTMTLEEAKGQAFAAALLRMKREGPDKLETMPTKPHTSSWHHAQRNARATHCEVCGHRHT
jgi:hypothetical protein